MNPTLQRERTPTWSSAMMWAWIGLGALALDLD